MHIHFIQHEHFEAPGAYLDWANQKGHTTSTSRVYQNEALPNSTNYDLLVVLGGPQDPATTTEQSPHFNAKAEIACIKQAIDANKKVIGVCLGAQLIGETLGAKFAHSPNREIGLFNLELNPEASNDPFFKTQNQTLPCGHWHGDMPGLTDQSKVLATTSGCPRQIVKYSDKVYGFQCHFEFTPEVIELMIQNCSHELEKYKDQPYIQNAETLRKNDYRPANHTIFAFLDYLEQT